MAKEADDYISSADQCSYLTPSHSTENKYILLPMQGHIDVLRLQQWIYPFNLSWKAYAGNRSIDCDCYPPTTSPHDPEAKMHQIGIVVLNLVRDLEHGDFENTESTCNKESA